VQQGWCGQRSRRSLPQLGLGAHVLGGWDADVWCWGWLVGAGVTFLGLYWGVVCVAAFPSGSCAYCNALYRD
jgi:hypothetical protein